MTGSLLQAPTRPLRLVPALALLLGLLVLLGLAPRASASPSVGEQIVERCTNGESLSGFTSIQYREALEIVASEAELEEYSPCGQIIRHAESTAETSHGSHVSGGGGGGTTSGPSPPGTSASAGIVPVTPGEQRSLERASHRGAAPVRVGKQVVQPGVVHTHIASALSSLPTSLQVVLAFLVACGLVAGAFALKTRYGGRLPAPFRAHLGLPGRRRGR